MGTNGSSNGHAPKRGRPHGLSDNQLADCARLESQGWSKVELARHFSVTVVTIRASLKRLDQGDSP